MFKENKCIPVELDQRGFTVSSEWIECDLPFPTLSEFKKKLLMPHDVVEDNINYWGISARINIYF